jgi:hypothetical protein
MKRLRPILGALLALLCAGSLWAGPAWSSPGLCTGPVCADHITRSTKNHWQLILRLNDQLGHREKVVIDCRGLTLSPRAGLVDRGYAIALGRRACRLAGAMG